MARHLVIYVWFHDRFHGMSFGAPEWPPSPARVFQALVAGVARGGSISAQVVRALEWLETLSPPTIGAPRSTPGAELTLWVPNNDLDAVGGDPGKVGKIRTQKRVVPRIVEGGEPLFYVWSWDGDPGDHPGVLIQAAERLYQLGRGVDLAWARAEIADGESLERLLMRFPGVVHLPGGFGDRGGSLCPMPGSLASLCRRHDAKRIREVVDGRHRRELFENAPKPLFRPVRYDRRGTVYVYDLLDARDEARAFPVSLRLVARLVEHVRDAAADRLRAAFPAQSAEIERILIGRKPDGRDAGPIADRVRIIPLPSIGHPHADLGVRRIAVELPGGASLAAEDLAWAFDGLSPAHQETGEVALVLARAESASMLERYRRVARSFRTVTPVVLPESAARRRIEPTRRSKEAKAGSERDSEERAARSAVTTALRHAGIFAELQTVSVQREPFDRRGARAESFAEGTRFAKERLWHVQVTVDRCIEGPTMLGDGRFLGLGLLAPEDSPDGAHAFVIEEGLVNGAAPLEVAAALRRAVLSRTQMVLGERRALPAYFSGHEADGAPARDTPHISFVFDSQLSRLLVLAPHVVDRREPDLTERGYLGLLDRALEGFLVLRAGKAGLLSLRRATVALASDPVFASSPQWRSVTPYRVTRHAKKGSATEAVSTDVVTECRRRGLPRPRRVTVMSTKGVGGVGLFGEVELEFARAVPGPIILGRSRHLGGGFFQPVGSGKIQ